jgi:hypothetical protein
LPRKSSPWPIRIGARSSASNLERAVVLETFCGETTAIPPHQTLHLKQSLPIPFASPFVSAKGEATGSEGSDRKRIRSASSHPGSIGGATPCVSKSQIAPINRVA